MRVAVVNPTGFYVGGAITLCVQYALIGIDAFIKDFVPNGGKKPSLPNNVQTYNTSAELLFIAGMYDRLIFIDLWHGTEAPDTVLDDLLAIQKANPSIELCWVYSSRTLTMYNELSPICELHNFRFDHIYSLNSELKKYVKGDILKIMRLNAYTPMTHDIVSLADRDNIVFSAGRVEAFKGTTRYISQVDEEFVSSDFIFEHDGATFNFHKDNNGVSCPPQLLSIFDTNATPKKVKSQYALKRYSESPEAHKFNIYPEYCVDDMYDVWKHHYAGVCCILGTKSGYKRSVSLFGTTLEIKDSAERKRIEKSAAMWNDDIEYADIEKLELQIPLLFSRRYAQIIHFTDERLIYDSFSQIPEKVKNLGFCYTDVVKKQQLWYNSNIADVNKQILEIFYAK